MKKLLCILLLLSGCAYLQPKPVQDPTFRLETLTIVERSDGTTLQVQREFKRVTQAEFDLLSEAEKMAWNLLKRQVGL